MPAIRPSSILLLAIGAVLAIGQASAGGRVAPAKSASDCFTAAFEANDADAVAACYADDAIIWFPGGPMARGRTAIRDGFAHFLGTMTVADFEITELGHETAGDVRIAWGTYRIRTIDKASKAEATQTGRFTDVQKKVKGRWLYTVDHPSDDPPPAPR